jgi:endogenous inhibitor of DNA gyrase (YacG/DUF329 family)
MTEAQKQQIRLRRAKGDSYAAIARALGISENTVKSYCRRNNIVVAINPEQTIVTDVCANCGRPLNHTQGAKHRRFCSDKCRMAWWKAHPEAVNRKALYRFICPTCGTEFEAYGNAGRKYCSRSCFGAARRASL